MSLVMLEDKAKEKSTFVVNASFEDEDGDAITPTSITWTLTDRKGRIINSRESVSVAVPAASNDIVLTGNDLALQQNDDRIRVFTVEAVYDSAAYGNDLTLNDEAEFEILSLLKVT